jgi:hypothetical protein
MHMAWRAVRNDKCTAKAYCVAEPLHGRDGDGAVKGARPQRQPRAEVVQAQVALHLPLPRHVQHGPADVRALPACPMPAFEHLACSMRRVCCSGHGAARTTQTCPASVSASPLSPLPQPRSSSSRALPSSGSASSSSARSVSCACRPSRQPVPSKAQLWRPLSVGPLFAGSR